MHAVRGVAGKGEGIEATVLAQSNKVASQSLSDNPETSQVVKQHVLTGVVRVAQVGQGKSPKASGQERTASLLRQIDYSAQITLLDVGSPRKELNEPLGIEVLAGYLRERVPLVNVDLQWLQLTNGKLKRKSTVFNSGLIGISTQLDSLGKIKKLVDEIMKENRDALIVFGNLYGTFAYKEMLELYPDSICVRGEGEDTIVSMASIRSQNPGLSVQELKEVFWEQDVPNIVFNQGNMSVRTSRRVVDLNNAVSPARDFLHETIEREGIVRAEGSRGCPYGLCKFCCVTSKYDYRGWRPFPIKKIIGEMEEISTAGGRALYFTDEDFVGRDPKRAIELSRQIVQAKKEGRIDGELNFYIDMRANTVITGTGQEVLAELKKAGLREVFIGIESGAVEQLERYGKRRVSSASGQALATLRNMGLEADIGFIMFDLESSLDDIKNNISFIRKHGIADHDARLIKRMRVEPETQLAEELRGDGVIRSLLDVNDLVYPFRFLDKRVQKVFDTFRAWERETSNLVYAIQALSRGEVPSEDERRKLKGILGEFRQLDLEFLESTVAKVESEGYKAVSLSNLWETFEERRFNIISLHAPYLESKGDKLKRLIANYTNRVGLND